MKKILLLLLTFVGMVSTASAVDNIYLRSNLNATAENSYLSWDSDNAAYQFTYVSTNDNKEDVFTYTINARDFSDDILFRLNISGWDKQLRPKDQLDFDFSDANNVGYELWSYDDSYRWQSGWGDHYFVIKHTDVKASQYKITLYQKQKGNGADGRIWMNVEIITMPVTIGSTGMATFCCNRALDFTGTGISAYTITGSVKATGALTTSSKLGAVPANTGLYLEGDEDTYNVPVLASASSVGTNWLVGVTSDTQIFQIDGDNTNYILTVNKADGTTAATPKFFKVYDDGDETPNETTDDGNTVPAGKAYLQIPTEDAAREFFWFDGETTAVKAVKQEQKFDGKVFNLAGQRIANPTKGLYIVNGKKVIK